jgi:hypothetical protein
MKKKTKAAITMSKLIRAETMEPMVMSARTENWSPAGERSIS